MTRDFARAGHPCFASPRGPISNRRLREIVVPGIRDRGAGEERKFVRRDVVAVVVVVVRVRWMKEERRKEGRVARFIWRQSHFSRVKYRGFKKIR